MKPALKNTIHPIYWDKDRVCMLDQRLLPVEEHYIHFDDPVTTGLAIRAMVIRGAPAIGIAAAMAWALAFKPGSRPSEWPGSIDVHSDETPPESIDALLEQASVSTLGARLEKRAAAVKQFLALMRPTAVNLFWALDEMNRLTLGWLHEQLPVLAGQQSDPVQLCRALFEYLKEKSEELHRRDDELCLDMAAHGLDALEKTAGGSAGQLLTHCNTGALATGGIGTALGVIVAAARAGRLQHVLVDETRPWLQGARLTAWELARQGINHSLISDNMAGYFMAAGKVDAVLVGADRIAANGDTANKIGTYSLAVLARYHKIPFYVVAPVYSMDFSMPDGSHITVEERGPEEVKVIRGVAIAPSDSPALNPAFDITPASLITAVISERGWCRSADLTAWQS